MNFASILLLIEFLLVNFSAPYVPRVSFEYQLTPNKAYLSLNSSAEHYRYVTIHNPKSATLKFEFACNVIDADSQSIYSAVKFCCQTKFNDEQPKCSEKFQFSMSRSSGSLTCNSVKFDYTIHKNNVTFTKSFSEYQFEPSGVIYCRFEGKNQVIDSNMIEFRSTSLYMNSINMTDSGNIGTKLVKVNQVYTSELPKEFHCFSDEEKETIASWPAWAKLLISTKAVQYFYCPFDGSFDKYKCLSSQKEFLPEDAFVDSDLGLHVMNSGLWNTNSHQIVIGCTRNNDTMKFWAGDLDESNPESPFIAAGIPKPVEYHDSKLRATSSTKKYVEFLKGTTIDGFRLTASYTRPFDGISYRWSHNFYDIPNNNANSLVLYGIASYWKSGPYKLSVNGINSGERIEFSFIMNIVGPPWFDPIGCLKPYTYIIEGQTLNKSCVERIGKATTLWGINGYEHDGDELALRILEEVKEPALVDLVQRMSIEPRKRIVFTNLKPGHDFMLTMFAKNDHGQSRIRSHVRTIPKPKLTSNLSNFAFAARSKEKFLQVTFRAKVDDLFMEEMRDKYDIRIMTDWLVNGKSSMEYEQHKLKKGIWRFITFSETEPEMITIYRNSEEIDLQQYLSRISETSIRVIFRIRYFFIKKYSPLIEIITQPDIEESYSDYVTDETGFLMYDSELEANPQTRVELEFITPSPNKEGAWLVTFLYSVAIILLICIIISIIIWRCRAAGSSVSENENENSLRGEQREIRTPGNKESRLRWSTNSSVKIPFSPKKITFFRKRLGSTRSL